MTETARLIRRIGRPHARARAVAILLAGAGVAALAAAAGIAFAPRLGGILAAWACIAATLVAAGIAVRRGSHASGAGTVGRLVEMAGDVRAGSVVGLLGELAAPGNVSVALWESADRRAAQVVERTRGLVQWSLRRGSVRQVAAGAAIAATGAVILVLASPGAGRAAAFWNPVRAWADARAPIRLRVDRSQVHRGDRIAATIEMPGGAYGRLTLWSRGPGEAWRPTIVTLDSAGRAVRTLGPLDADLWLRASTGARRSPELRVTVSLPAFIAGVSLTARFPHYLERPDEPIAIGPGGVDTVSIPEGTTLLVSGTASVPVATGAFQRQGEGGEATALSVRGTTFSGTIAPRSSGRWSLALRATDGSPFEGPAPALDLRLVPDSAPLVRVPVPGMDTTLPLSLLQPIVIDARDDHGLSRMNVVSWRVGQTGVVGQPQRDSVAVAGMDRAIVQAVLDAGRRALIPGDTLRFYVEAWDNAPQAHRGQSQEYALRLPSRAELRAAMREAAQDVSAAADSVAAAQSALSQRTADLAAERTRGETGRSRDPEAAAQPAPANGSSLSYQSTERAAEVARQEQAIAQRVEQLSRDLSEIAQAAHGAGFDDSAFQAQLRDVRQLLERAITPELEQRLRDLQAAMERLDPDAVRQALQRLAQAQQQLKETLERSQELFRRAAVEGQLASSAADAEELRDRQKAWNRDEARHADSAAAAHEGELGARADSLAANIAQASKDLAATGQASEALAQPEATARRAQAAMNEAATAAGEHDPGGAVQSGEAAAAALDSLPETLRQRRDSLAKQWRQETLDALDRAMSETAALARRQQQLTAGLDQQMSPTQARAQQASIEEGTQAVARQIEAAGARHAMVSPGLQSSLGYAQKQMQAAREQLDQAQPNEEAAARLAGEATDALNGTVMALARSRAEVAGAASGTGFQEAMEQLARMAGQQQGLNGEALGLMPSLGTGGAQVLAQLRALAARQRALAEELERMQATGAGSSAAGPLAAEARDLARQLEAGRLDRQTVERQERLYRRMLDAGRTLSGPEPDPDKERTSRPAIGDSVHLPGVLRPGATGAGPRLRYPTWDELNGLTPEQRRLVLEYFRRINAPEPR